MKKSLYLIILLTGAYTSIFSQHSGPNTPGTYSATGSGSSWGNLSGINAIDNNPAYVDLAQYPTCNSFLCYYSNLVSYTGFLFAIPSNATITGVQIDALQRVNSPGGGIHDSELVLTLNGSQIGMDYADTTNWLDTPTLRTYGDSTDTWGSLLYPADVNDPTFGIQYRLTNLSYDQTASLDYLTMTVYYQSGTNIKSQTSSLFQIGLNEKNLSIKAGSELLSDGVLVEIRNVTGQLFYENSFLQNSGKLDLTEDVANWPAGIYVIHISTSSGVNYKKKVVIAD